MIDITSNHHQVRHVPRASWLDLQLMSFPLMHAFIPYVVACILDTWCQTKYCNVGKLQGLDFEHSLQCLRNIPSGKDERRGSEEESRDQLLTLENPATSWRTRCIRIKIILVALGVFPITLPPRRSTSLTCPTRFNRSTWGHRRPHLELGAFPLCLNAG